MQIRMLIQKKSTFIDQILIFLQFLNFYTKNDQKLAILGQNFNFTWEKLKMEKFIIKTMLNDGNVGFEQKSQP